MPPKLSLKRKAESKPAAASEPPQKKTVETPVKSVKKYPKLRLTLAPYQWKKGNKTKQGGGKNKISGYEWKPLPASNVLEEIYLKAHSKDAERN